MARSKTPLVFLGLLFLAASSYWAWTAPARTLAKIQQAMIDGDVRKLSRHVDFPALRSNLGSGIRAEVARLAQLDDHPLGAGVELLGGMMTTPLIDKVVTPEFVISTAKAEARTQDSWVQQMRSGNIRYRDMDEASIEVGNERRVWLVFERRGLWSWVLVDLDITSSR